MSPRSTSSMLDPCLDPFVRSSARAPRPASLHCPSQLVHFSSGSLLLSPPPSSPREPALSSDLPPRCPHFCPLVSEPNPDGPTQSVLCACSWEVQLGLHVLAPPFPSSQLAILPLPPEPLAGSVRPKASPSTSSGAKGRV